MQREEPVQSNVCNCNLQSEAMVANNYTICYNKFFNKIMTVFGYNLHTQDVSGIKRKYVLQSFDKVEQWQLNEIQQIYFPSKRTCQGK